MPELSFYKYQGLGNDFVIIDEMNVSVKTAGEKNPSLSFSTLSKLCDRNYGVGADGVLTVFATSNAETVAYMHITNADGSIAEMCGNGLRCVVQWLIDQGKVEPNFKGNILTDSGVRSIQVKNNLITVDMGLADFTSAANRGEVVEKWFSLPAELGVLESKIKGTAVKVGNQHLVLDYMANDDEIIKLGPYFSGLPLFPKKANIEFVEILNQHEIKLTVWEHGVGLTLACGTGACAAVSALVKNKHLPANKEIIVKLKGGTLCVTVYEENDKKFADRIRLRNIMSGSAEHVFSGVLSADWLKNNGD
ncbi:MAG: diaminopimelate epimerase [bacterium]|nr:diaminopimelate epimerase [bacterium]